MDFIFKFGVHYYESDPGSFLTNLLLTVLGSFFGLLGALYIDALVKRHAKNKEIEKLHEEFTDRLGYLKILIQEVLKSVEQQNKICEGFWKSIEEDPHEIQFLKVVSSNDTKRILNLESQNSFLAFRHFFEHDENWLKDLRSMNTSIDFIDSYFPEIDRIFKSYLKAIYQFSLDYKSYLDELPTVMAKELTKMKREIENYNKDPRYIFLNENVLQYHKLINQGKRLKAFDTEFLEPLLIRTLEHYINEPFADPILDMCKKARVKLNDLKLDALGTAEEFKNLPSLTEKSVNSLKELIQKIEQKLS
jgi:hypothetical protein